MNELDLGGTSARPEYHCMKVGRHHRKLIQHFIHEVAKQTNSVAFQPCWSGYSPHHMGYKGTVTFNENTLLSVLMDTFESLGEHGIKRFVISNHHGGNSEIFQLAARLAKLHYNVMVATPSGPNNTELARERSDRQKRYWDVHSGPTETSGALYLFPELVEMWRLEDWKPTLKMQPELYEYMDPDRKDFELVSQIRNACMPPINIDFTSCTLSTDTGKKNRHALNASDGKDEEEWQHRKKDPRAINHPFKWYKEKVDSD